MADGSQFTGVVISDGVRGFTITAARSNSDAITWGQSLFDHHEPSRDRR